MYNYQKNTRILIFITIFILMTALLTGCIGTRKIVYINSALVISSFSKTQVVRAEIQKIVDPYQKEVEGIGTELQTLQTSYQTMVSNLTSTQKKNLEKKITEKRNLYAAYLKELNTSVARLEAERMSPVYQELNGLIQDFGKKKGYDIIFNATSAGNIVYAKKGKDVSDDLIKFLSEKMNKKEKSKDNSKKGDNPPPADK